MEARSFRPREDDERLLRRREDMVRGIEEEALEVLGGGLRGGRLARRVLAAMRRVPRHEFVPPLERTVAYVNQPLPIGHGQTISQPFIVAYMTHLLGPTDDHVVLEVGTGSGYQAAVLAELARRVYTVEAIASLATSARDRLRALGYANVEVRTGDGTEGWPEHAPYDGIVVTAAAARVPSALIEQLSPGGRLVIPIGDPDDVQWLTVIDKSERGPLEERPVLPVRFVPLVGPGG